MAADSDKIKAAVRESTFKLDFSRMRCTLEEISFLTPALAKLCADRTHKTLRRDNNELAKIGLVVAGEPCRWKPNVDIIPRWLEPFTRAHATREACGMRGD
jgi:hypothetical protein